MDYDRHRISTVKEIMEARVALDPFKEDYHENTDKTTKGGN